MSLLTEKPPTELLGVPIRCGYADMVRLSCLLVDEELPEMVRYAAALDMFYIEPVSDVHLAWEKMLWFYAGGEERNVGGSGKGARLYDFEQDGNLIWAAFLAQYGIDLTEVRDLHWWKFRAMFRNLDEQQQISRIMGWRGVDTKDMSKRQAAEYKRLKREYAIKKPQHGRALTVAERDRRMKAKLDEMYAIAKART